MRNADIARLFEELADLLEVEGANAFRVRAYRNAARTVEDYSGSIATLAEQGTSALTELPGIGDDLAKKIVTIVETQRLPQLDEIKQRVPAVVLDMLRIPNLGPKKTAALVDALKGLALASLVSGGALAGDDTGRAFLTRTAGETLQAAGSDLALLRGRDGRATAASTTLPPCLSISSPAWLAAGWSAATTAF